MHSDVANKDALRDPFKGLSEQQFESIFDDTSRQKDLEKYFGEENYQEIIKLRAQAKRRTGLLEEKVLILPGIMGSELAVLRPGGKDVVWLEWWDIVSGDLFSLELGENSLDVKAVGVLRRYYYKLKVFLESVGFDTEFFPFDWRLSIKESGQRLSNYIAKLDRPVHLVAHSMGGLVARVAADPQMPVSRQIKRVVQLGTPNYGSFSPALAFRGTHEVARKIALLDVFHNIDDYRSRLFMRYPGFYEMLPSPEKTSGLDLFQSANWPKDVYSPDARYLASASRFQRELYSGNSQFVLIAGINQETIIAAEVDTINRQFVYTKGVAGDGTVPLACCKLPKVETYYTNTEHGALPNDNVVEEATGELLQTGSTTRLPTNWDPPGRPFAAGFVTDNDLKAKKIEIDKDTLSEAQKREFLSGFLSTSSELASVPPEH